MKSKSLLVFLLALWASLAVHAWDFTEHLIGYNILNGTEVEVDMIIPMELYPDEFQNVTIPQQVSFHDVSYNVIGINANAFYNWSIPVSITLPEGLMTIGDNAFRGCSSLTNINLPESLTSIGDYAFYGCPNLTIMTIPEGLTSIGNFVFCGCSVPTSITIPESLTDIGDYAFSSCTNLNSITLPEGVTSIGDHTFYRCSSLTSITLPESLTNIGNNAFHLCSSLTSITLPENLTTIGNLAFANCSSLANINFPEGLTSIGESAFSGCSTLTNIVIPEGWTSIVKNAFRGCSNLTSITLPKTLTSIGESAFSWCSSLTNINLPAGLTSIGDYAFDRCSSLTSITLPKGLTSIGHMAFYKCSSLTSVNAQIQEPFSIGSIDFYHISSDCVLTVPAGTKDAYIAKGWTTDVFKGGIVEMDPVIDFVDSKVKAICVEKWDTNNDGELSYEEAAAVTSLGEVFKENTEITSFDELQYFTGLREINKLAFYNCSNLASVRIPGNVSTIKEGAFRYCSKLKNLVIEDSSQYLYCYHSYYYNSGHIYSCFSDCPLESVYIGRDMKNHQSPYYVSRYLGFFYQKTTLSSLELGEKVTEIESLMFSGCDGLTTVYIPNSVTSIGMEAFYYCINLTSVVIPNSVTFIGEYAFSGCSNLTSVVSNIQEPFTFGSYAFSDKLDNCVLTVPAGTKADYIAAGWTEEVFKGGIVEMDGSVSVTLGSAGAATFCSVHDLDFFGTDDVKAYIVSAFSPSAGEVMLTRVYDVPAGTGIVLLGNAGTYDIPIGTGETVTSNLLVGTTADKTLYKVSGSYTNFVLANGASGLGFYTVADGSVLAAGKAYLPLLTAGLPSSAAQFSFRFNDDGTSFIRSLDVKDTREGDDWFSLDGRQLNAEPTAKSLYIRNGRKVIVR